MRADRLVAATLYLQRHGRVTAADLADHLEVSVATARRDLEALSSAGVPVYPQRGRGGGWQLVGGARTDLTGLTQPEVRALFLALAPADDDDGDATAAAALAKLVRALPAPFRDEAETAASAVRRDARGWESRPSQEPPVLARLRDAVVRRWSCTIGYRKRGAHESRRIAVDPWRLVDKAGVVYLLAGSSRGPRTYRLDRIDDVTVHEAATFERPTDAELDAQWERAVDVVTRARTGVTARIRADATALAVLADRLGTAFVAGDIDGEAVVAAHTERGLAEQLAGWGARVEVLEPAGVIAELRQIGSELVRAYSS